ncbi:MAG: hypothetical protein U9R14_02730 [Patescibacteria group bacterium]|nr:hypothetical protein [Patescibacteria group bacterium]
MRKTGIIIGSLSDLDQCLRGFEYLIKMVEKKLAEVYWVDASSQHRHTLIIQSILAQYSMVPAGEKIDALIMGAGWANHLSGCADSFLRYTLQDGDITVIGVAFEDPENLTHARAAILSSSEVPGNQMILENDKGESLVGEKGFLWACQHAVEGTLPKVKAKTPPEYKRMTIYKARDLALEMKKIKEKEV